MNPDKLNFIQRIEAPTPKWFKLIRTTGLIFSAIGGTLVAAPVALPAVLVTVGSYLLLGGTLASAIAQTAVSTSESPENPVKIQENSSENQNL